MLNSDEVERSCNYFGPEGGQGGTKAHEEAGGGLGGLFMRLARGYSETRRRSALSELASILTEEDLEAIEESAKKFRSSS